jgi:hypothetical protein
MVGLGLVARVDLLSGGDMPDRGREHQHRREKTGGCSMNSIATWLTAAGVVVAIFAVVVPLTLRRGDRMRAENEKLRTENQILRDTNIDLKIQLGSLQGTAAVIDRTFSGLLEQKKPKEPA